MITTISEKWYQKLKRAGFVFPLCEEEAYPGKHLLFRFHNGSSEKTPILFPRRCYRRGHGCPRLPNFWSGWNTAALSIPYASCDRQGDRQNIEER